MVRRERKRGTERQTDKQTERETGTDRRTENGGGGPVRVAARGLTLRWKYAAKQSHQTSSHISQPIMSQRHMYFTANLQHSMCLIESGKA